MKHTAHFRTRKVLAPHQRYIYMCILKQPSNLSGRTSALDAGGHGFNSLPDGHGGQVVKAYNHMLWLL